MSNIGVNLLSTKYAVEKKYWVKKLSGEAGPVSFPYDHVLRSKKFYRCYDYVIEQHLAEQILDFSGGSEYKLQIILTGIVSLLLHKYSLEENLLIGTTLYKQKNLNIADIMNDLLILKIQITENGLFRDLLLTIKDELMESLENRNYPLRQKHADLQVMSNIFKVFVLLTNIQEPIKGADIDSELVFRFNKEDRSLTVCIEYDASLYEESTIAKIVLRMERILQQTMQNPGIMLQEVEAVSEEEKHQLLNVFNSTDHPYPQKTIDQLFAERVERLPDEIVLIFEDRKVSYSELDNMAQGVANSLLEQGVQSEDIVGILVNRGIEMIVGILGVLKAGCAYLPIDPALPAQRIDYMLRDSGAKVMLVERIHTQKWYPTVQLNIEELKHNQKNLAKRSQHNSNNLAYVIYTSGSTGQPKGVMIEHRNVVNFIYSMKRKLNLQRNWSILGITSISFDIFGLEILLPLITGMKIVLLANTSQQSPEEILNVIKEKQVQVLQLTPTRFKMLFMEKDNLKYIDGVRKIIIGGEEFPVHFYEQIKEDIHADVYNVYGPTETTIWSTLNEIKDDTNIGKPIDNTRIYIMDKHRKLVPLGVAGEMYIGGDGVGRGYRNKPDLTAERFVQDSLLSDGVIYRTGDIARWLPNGTIEFIGRVDHHVKIRGYRIELGEIEKLLLKYEMIKEAVVKEHVDQSGNKVLCAYMVSTSKELRISELRKFLSDYLPEYMIPAYFIQLDSIPVNANGKIDRRALPEPKGLMLSEVEYVAPRNQIEENLVSIWSRLLSIDKIGINDNFFHLGGHSLKVNSMVSKIYQELSIDIPLSEVFNHPTVKELAEVIVNAKQMSYPFIRPAEKKRYYATSSMQKRLYIQCQLEGECTSYNMPGAVSLKGSLDLGKLEQVFKSLIIRHESFRTSFEMIDGEIVQIIHNDAELQIQNLVVDGADVSQCLGDMVRPFDLRIAPLLRVGIIKIAEDHHIMVFDMHHIISDGVSIEILITEFVALYQGSKLPDLIIQYKDFSEWQNELFESNKIVRQKQYWLDKLRGDLPVLNLPYDFSRPSFQSFKGDHLRREIDQKLTRQIKEMAKKTGSTTYMVLMAAFNILLYKYTAQNDIIIGSPIAGRRQEEAQHIIGLFINMLVLRNQLCSSQTFNQFLSQVRRNTLEAYDNQDYQYEELLRDLNLQKNLSQNPLFDLVFSLHTVAEDSYQLNDLTLTPLEFENKTSKFDLTLDAIEEKDKISFSLEYCIDLFKKDTMERFLNSYITILHNIAQNPDMSICDIQVLSTLEKKQILEEFNATNRDFPRDKTIHQLITERAEKYPDDMILFFEEQRMTYVELNHKTNQLARFLREHGAGRDKIIGIVAERSIELIVGILGVLKAGSAYLPIAPDFPSERIHYIVEDCQTDLLLVQEDYVDKIDFYEKVFTLGDESLYTGDDKNIENINSPDDLAYIMYTSGSTGKPKGVMLKHAGVVNISQYYNDLFELENKHIVHMGNVAFDASIVEIFPPLIYGGKIYIIRKEQALDKKKFLQFIQKHQIQIAQFVPVTVKELLSEAPKPESLETILVAGDRLEDQLKDRLLDLGYHLTNHYGPTEGTVDSIVAICEKSKTTIGKPIYNTRAYIFDKDNNPAPVGVPGELCIAGVGLARGYVNNSQLTSEKFVVYSTIPEERIYKTGDLACWQADGTITFLGRVDNQVKLRGYRVEPGEIELQLLQYAQIKEAIVVDKVDSTGTKYLCAYVVTDGDEPIIVSELRKFLVKKLPDYMVPARFVQIDYLPLNYNGKVDRKALPEPEWETGLESECALPTNDIEEKLAKIWCQILDVNQTGVNHNFFDLGGHSLKATTLIAKIYEEFDVEMPLSYVFKNPTIKQLAEFIDETEKNAFASIQPVEVKDYYPVSSAQKRLYIVCQFEEAQASYSIPGSLIIEGNLDIKRLEFAFKQLISRHEVLRTSFSMIDGEIVQKIFSEVEFTVNFVDRSKEGCQLSDCLAELIAESRRPFDLSETPLLRVGLIKLKTDQYILYYNIHHIICDGISTNIMIKDLVEFYQYHKLPELRIQYKDFSVWQNALMKTNLIKQQEKYWTEVFTGEIPVLNMPTDFPRLSVQSFEGNCIDFAIDEYLAKQITLFAKRENVTLFMLFLASYNVLLAKYTGQEDIVVGSPIAGRTHSDLRDILGMFVNTVAFRNYPRGGMTFREFLQNVKENALQAYENQDYQFEQLIEKLNIPRDFSRNPLFDTIVVMDNFENETLEFSGLKFKPFDFAKGQTKFDLTLRIAEGNGRVLCRLEYCAKLFKTDSMQHFVEHYVQILREITNHPDVQLDNLDMISPREKQTVLYDFNRNNIEYPETKTLLELFEKQVQHSPNNIAVTFENQQLTYVELNRKANQIARVLRSKGVQPEHIVGIMVNNSINTIIGIFAILKAGGAYLPVDAEYPVERIRYMLADANVNVLLLENPLEVNYEVEMISIIDQEATEENDNLDVKIIPKNLFYVIYTSGTTGKPKGVMIEHGNIVHYTKWFSSQVTLHETDKSIVLSSFGFDLCYTSVYPVLLSGGQLHIVSKDTYMSVEKLIRYIKEKGISYLKITPSFFSTLLHAYNVDELVCSDLRLIILGGEAVNPQHIEEFMNLNSQVQIMNHYGPTETTIGTIAKMISWEDFSEFKSRPVIGKPIANAQIYILDEYKKIAGIGVPGELYIAGDGVGRGYVNNQQLTQEKFITNPYVPDQRMYKTGDLARFLPNGDIQFLGRLDHQVKIRGYRIEVAEVQNKLLEHQAITEAIVLTREDNNGKYLCAYFVGEIELDAAGLREYLAQDLPEYMIPSYFMQLTQLPLTMNGKVDLKALPEQQRFHHETEYVKPRNYFEEIMVEVWKGVLGVAEIGIKDNFFQLGGDSIKAIQTVSRLHRYGLKMEIKDLFKHHCIADVSPFIRKITMSVDQNPVVGEVKLSPVQKWFFAQEFKNMYHYNQAIMLFNKEGFDEILMKKVITKIVEHHDALRMVYRFDGKRVQQYNKGLESPLFELAKFDLTNLPNIEERMEEEANRIQNGISLECGSLAKFGLFVTNEGDHLLIVIHHLVIDGISWRLLIEDLATAYTQAKNGEEIRLPHKTHSFKDWVDRLDLYAHSNTLQKQLNYWLEIAQTKISPLPSDHAVDSRKIKDVTSISMVLDEIYTEKLLKYINGVYNTEINDILLTALGLTFQSWTGDNKVLVSLEGHGREEIMKDLDITRTVGWFTSIYPVLLVMDHSNNISYQIRTVKECLRRIPDKGIGYGILRYLTDTTEDLSVNPAISFNYLGQFSTDIDTEVFSISTASQGRTMDLEIERKYVFDIHGMVAGNKLILNFDYNQFEYESITVQKLVDSYLYNLKSIIEHCLEHSGVREVTPSDLGDLQLSLTELDTISSVLGREKVTFEKIFALSPMQQGILFYHLLDPASKAYFGQTELQISGEIDLSLFEKSYNQLVQRYEILRTNYVYQKLPTARQVVLKERIQDIYFEDLSNLTEYDRQVYLLELKEKDFARGFDLTRGNLMRVAVLKVDSERYHIIWSYHHIIMDGWCSGIILRDFFTIYSSCREGIAADLNKVYPYSNYINWLTQQDYEEARHYWENYLTGYQEYVFPLGYNKFSEHEQYELKEEIVSLSPDLFSRLEAYGRDNNVTINTICQAVWGILLQKYNFTDDVIFGAVVSGRPPEIEGIEHMVGLFINTLPVRVRSQKRLTFKHLGEQLQHDSVLSRRFEYSLLAELQSFTELKRNLVNNLVIFENYPVEKEIKGSVRHDIGFRIDSIEKFEQTNYDFNITIVPIDGLQFRLSYNAHAYSENNVKRMGSHLLYVLKTIVLNPEIHVENIEILTEEEKRYLLSVVNNQTLDCSDTKTLHQLFEEQVIKTPMCPAVGFAEKTLTYRELNARANQLAIHLRKHGVTSETVVGLMIERSIEMVIGILGILKAGGAYLPIDSKYPPERKQYMLNDSGVQRVLTTKRIIDQQLVSFVEMIYVEEAQGLQEENLTQEVTVKPENLAYVIYTSGSTGRAKGVMIEHRNVTSFLASMSKRLELSTERSILGITTVSFDIFGLELFLALTTGMRLELLSEEEQFDPDQVLTRIDEKEVDIIQLTPSRLKMLFWTGDSIQKLRNVKKVIVGGEEFPDNLYRQIRSVVSGDVYNVYGPTETTIWSTIKKLADEVNIGKPLDNTDIYILDRNGMLCSIGMVGELCIGGEGVARGYLNRAELTEEKFRVNPYTGAKIYLTGDMARWLEDGNIEFLGRKDYQVKIRGYRIEPGEIENALTMIAEVKAAVVVVREESEEKQLCAYYVAESKISVDEIKKQLRQMLPEYMVPGLYMEMSCLPMNSNGKVNRNALPVPQLHSCERDTYQRAENEVEAALLEIWEEILHVQGIGVLDNFFEIGGHSITLIQLLARVQQEFDRELKISSLIDNLTIRNLSRLIQNEKNPENIVSEEYFVFNKGRQKRIFAFPPTIGFGLVYKPLADQLQNYTMYAFNFIEDPERIEKYVDIMMDLHPEEEYILVGYSAGGNLAFEVAKELNQRGQIVLEIVMLDSVRKTEAVPFDAIEYESEKMKINEIVANNEIWLPFKDHIVTTCANYLRYYNELVNAGTVDCNIQLITSEGRKKSEVDWSSNVSKHATIYNGTGEHRNMLTGENLVKNAIIVGKILDLTLKMTS